MTTARLLHRKGGPAAAGVKDGFGKAQPQAPEKQLSSVVMPVWSSNLTVVRLTKDYPDKTMVYDGGKICKIVKGLYTTKPHPKPTEAEVVQFKADVENAAKTDEDIAGFIRRCPFPKAG